MQFKHMVFIIRRINYTYQARILIGQMCGKSFCRLYDRPMDGWLKYHHNFYNSTLVLQNKKSLNKIRSCGDLITPKNVKPPNTFVTSLSIKVLLINYPVQESLQIRTDFTGCQISFDRGSFASYERDFYVTNGDRNAMIKNIIKNVKEW
jgi:hypothetical protein